MKRTPIIDHDTAEAPVFKPGNLLEGARRQKSLADGRVPAGCLLDMDGEIVERLVASGRAAADPAWPCFHTKLYRWKTGDADIGVVGGTVGAPFAVLVAEELFASGCEALVWNNAWGPVHGVVVVVSRLRGARSRVRPDASDVRHDPGAGAPAYRRMDPSVLLGVHS